MRRRVLLTAAALLVSACGGSAHHAGPGPAVRVPVPPLATATPPSSPPSLTFASPPAAVATSTCDSPDDLYVETHLVTRSLVSCFGGVQEPTPRLTVTVDTVLRIVGALNGPVTLAPGQTVLRAAGMTLTALRPGTSTISTAGERCNLGTDPFGLLTVVVTAG